MPYAIQTRSVTVASGKLSFDFSQSESGGSPVAGQSITDGAVITSALVGLSRFNLHHPDNKAHWVQYMSLSLGSPAVSGQVVDVDVSSTFGKADDVRSQYSSVKVTCLVRYDETLDQWAFADSQTVTPTSSRPFELTNQLTGVDSVLSGFSLAMDKSGKIARFKVASGMVGAVQSETSLNRAYLSGMGCLESSVGRAIPTRTTLDVAAIGNQPGELYIHSVQAQQSSHVPVQFPGAVSAAGAFIQSCTAQAKSSDGYDVKQIGGGNDSLTVDGATASLSNVSSFIYNQDGDYQNNADSYATMLVVGIPDLNAPA